MSNQLNLSFRIGAALASGFKSTFATVKGEVKQVETATKSLNGRIGGLYKAQMARYKESGGTGIGGVAGIVGAAYAFSKPIKQAVEFESVMADVRKVVDMTDSDFKSMGRSLLDMSTRIPMAASGLGAIMAAAGQAGIARTELLRFTEDAAKMGVAFDLSGEQAGAAMSGLRSIFSLTQDQVVSMGDAINYLSNKMDAHASDLLNVTNRAGSTAKLYGLTGQQLNALGASFLALKSPPEVAATGINAMLMKMATADKQNKKFQEGLERLGFTAQGLKRMIGQDAQGAIVALLDRVKGSSDVMGNLSDLFGLEYADDIAKLVGSLDTYKNAIKLVSEPTAYAGSMLKEYEERAKTTQNNMELLSGKFTKLGVTVGSVLLPALNSGIDVIGKLVSKGSELAEVFPGLVYGAGVLGAAVAGYATYVGAATTAQWAWNAAMTANPIGLVVAGVAALGAAAYVVYKNWEPVSRWIGDNVFTPIGNAADTLKTVVTTAFESAAILVKSIWEPVVAWFKEKFAWLGRAVDWSKSVVTKIGNVFDMSSNASMRSVSSTVGATVKGTPRFGATLSKDYPSYTDPKLAKAKLSDIRLPQNVNHQNQTNQTNQTIHFNITQKPGENSEELANRVASILDRKQAAEKRRALHD